jgi:peptidoglycan hydrolase CwlO-like protein
MKRVLFFSIVFWAIVSPALAELTVQDLEKIRSIIKEEIADEIASIKTEIASMKTEITSIDDKISSVKEDVESLSGRVDGIEKQITWLMGVIIVVVGIPQVIVVWRSRKDREQEKRIEELAREIETLKQQIANS